MAGKSLLMVLPMVRPGIYSNSENDDARRYVVAHGAAITRTARVAFGRFSPCGMTTAAREVDSRYLNAHAADDERLLEQLHLQ